MNVKGAPIIAGIFAAMLAYLVAFSYFLSEVLPECVINRMRIFADILANVIVDILATITDVTALNRAVNSGGLSNRLPANLTWPARMRANLAVMFISTRRRAGFRLPFAVRGPIKFFAANDTNKDFCFSFPITRTGTKLRLCVPFIHGNRWVFVEDFTTLGAAF